MISVAGSREDVSGDDRYEQHAAHIDWNHLSDVARGRTKTEAPNNKPLWIGKSEAADFQVTEIPRYHPTGDGPHIWFELEKKNTSTLAVVKKLSEISGIHKKQIGFAGRKDVKAITRQWFSAPADAEPFLTRLESNDIRILHVEASQKKLKLGHLLGNRFHIVLRAAPETESVPIESEADQSSTGGFWLPNWFGHQRFGVDGRNVEDVRRFLDLRRKARSRSDRFLVSAFQSMVFQGLLEEFLSNPEAQTVGYVMSATGRHARFEPDVTRFQTIFSGQSQTLDESLIGLHNEGISIPLCPALPMIGRQVADYDLWASAMTWMSEWLQKYGVTDALINHHPALVEGTYRSTHTPVFGYTSDVQPSEIKMNFDLLRGAYATQIVDVLLDNTVSWTQTEDNPNGQLD